MLKLDDELFLEFVIDGVDGKWAGFVGQKVAVIGRRQMKLQVF